MGENLRRLRVAAKLSQAALAERAGVSQQLISQIEANTNKSTKELPAIAFALGVAVHRIDEEYDIPVPDDELSKRVRTLKVAAHVQAGHWAETWEWADEDQYEVAVPLDPALKDFRLYGAETRGPSMNRRWPEGTVVVFTHVEETHESPTPGKRYVVERRRYDGAEAEYTVKLLHLDADGRLWLVPESDDPRFQAPIAIDDGVEDETVRIVGRVWYAVTRE
ncbi:MAG: XRE family transcriptional regulator [Flavobacteriaceae bacterium]